MVHIWPKTSARLLCALAAWRRIPPVRGAGGRTKYYQKSSHLFLVLLFLAVKTMRERARAELNAGGAHPTGE